MMVQKHLRDKSKGAESNEVVEIAKLDAQEELLFFPKSSQYPSCNLRNCCRPTLYNDITLTTQASR